MPRKREEWSEKRRINMNITTERIAAATKKLCEAPGPSGRECAAYAAAKELLSPMGEVKRTPLGSLLCCVNEGKEGAPHLLLEAHLDQIGFLVTEVLDGGFLRFAPVGGVDPRMLLGGEVTILADEPLYAVVSGGRLLPCLSCRSSTRAVLARHLRPVALERCASDGMRSFAITGFGGIVPSTYAFFQPMMSPSSGRMLILARLSFTWLA